MVLFLLPRILSAIFALFFYEPMQTAIASTFKPFAYFQILFIIFPSPPLSNLFSYSRVLATENKAGANPCPTWNSRDQFRKKEGGWGK